LAFTFSCQILLADKLLTRRFSGCLLELAFEMFQGRFVKIHSQKTGVFYFT